MFKIKDVYKLELKTLETMKLFAITKKLIENTMNGENVPSFKVVDKFLVPYNLVDNQYQKKSEVLYIFTPNKSYAFLLNVEPSSLVFLSLMILLSHLRIKRWLEVEDKVDLILLINK